MFSYRRLEQLLNRVHTNSYVPAAKLAESLNVSPRTIRTDINNINAELEPYGAQVKLKRKAGYYLEITDQQAYKQLEEYHQQERTYPDLENSDDRIRYLLSAMIYATDYINPDDFIDQLYISKNTLANYIRSIKNIIEHYNLDYVVKPGKGVKIIGNESDKRDCILNEILSQNLDNYVTSFTEQEYNLFKSIDLKNLKNIITSHLADHHIKTDDYSLKNLIIHFALTISRVMNDDYISMNSSIMIPDEIKGIINEICNDIEKEITITITRSEKTYIGMHMMADIRYQDDNIDDALLEKRITQLLDLIYTNYSFDLRNDPILKKDLFNHIKYSLAISHYPVHNHNPLLNTIRTNYPLPYDIAETTVKQCFHTAPYVMNEDDIGYIALHIGAAIERCFSGSLTRKAVDLVCGSGQATVRMLEARLNNVFGNKISILNRYSYHEFEKLSQNDLDNVDFVISTIPLKSDRIPVINVDFSLKQEDIENISHFLTAIDSDKANKLKKFFSPSLFFKKEKAISKDALLEEMVQQLRKENIVDDRFLESVLKRESIANTNMNNVFALPHPMSADAKETKVAVALLDQPVTWSDKASVRIVFLLAIARQDQQNIEHLYDIFIEIVNNPKFQQELLECQNYSQFIQSVLNHINL